MQHNSFSSLAFGALAALTLSGCAAVGNTHPSAHGAGADKGAMMDMASMCQKHRQMMAAKSAAEQQAMMDEHMKKMSMSKETMQAHMQSMQERCK